MSNLVERVS